MSRNYKTPKMSKKSKTPAEKAREIRRAIIKEGRKKRKKYQKKNKK